MKIKIYLVFLIVMIVSSGCVTTKKYNALQDEFNEYKTKSVKIVESHKVNLSEPTDDKMINLPRSTTIFRSDLESLIGEIFVVTKEGTGSTELIDIGNYRKQGSAGGTVKKTDLSSHSELYGSRVTGGFTSKLTILSNSANFNLDSLYDVSLQPIESATLKANPSYYDLQNSTLYSNIPDVFKEIYIVTAVEYRTLSYREYHKMDAEADINVTGVKLEGEAYYSDETIETVPIMCFHGADFSEHFGDKIAGDNLGRFRKTDRSASTERITNLITVPQRFEPFNSLRTNEIEKLFLDEIKDIRKLDEVIP